MSNMKRRKRTIFSSYAKQWMLSAASAAIFLSSSFAAHAATNINLAVASNFYGVPPSNSAITDLINAFEIANPTYTVTVVDNGATTTLAIHIISGNMLNVDLFWQQTPLLH
jgi:molybdate transport system substrate-binding protein